MQPNKFVYFMFCVPNSSIICISVYLYNSSLSNHRIAVNDVNYFSRNTVVVQHFSYKISRISNSKIKPYGTISPPDPESLFSTNDRTSNISIVPRYKKICCYMRSLSSVIESVSIDMQIPNPFIQTF